MPAMLLPLVWPVTAWVDVFVPLQVAWLQMGTIALTLVTVAGFLFARLKLLTPRRGGGKVGLLQLLGLDFDMDTHIGRRLLWSMSGWLWVVLVSLLTAPLFSIPALSACSEFYPRSYIFGAVVEAAAAVIHVNSPGIVI